MALFVDVGVAGAAEVNRGRNPVASSLVYWLLTVEYDLKSPVVGEEVKVVIAGGGLISVLGEWREREYKFDLASLL